MMVGRMGALSIAEDVQVTEPDRKQTTPSVGIGIRT